MCRLASPRRIRRIRRRQVPETRHRLPVRAQEADQQGYVKWSKYMDEQQGILNAHVEKVTKAYNKLARLLDAG